MPKSGSLTLHYTCTTDGSRHRKNTATATWDKAVYFTPTGSASAEAPVAFAIAKETNKVITVVDDKTVPGSPVTLGTWNWADGEHTFTYSLGKPGVAGTCTDYTNIATIQETQQSDSQKVTVCVGKDLDRHQDRRRHLDRTYKWLIDKSVDDTKINIAAGRHRHLQLRRQGHAQRLHRQRLDARRHHHHRQPERLASRDRQRERHPRQGRHVRHHRGRTLRRAQEQQPNAALHLHHRRHHNQEHRHRHLECRDLLHANRHGHR